MREHKMNAETVLGQFIKRIRWHFVGTSGADEYGEVTFLKQQSVTRFPIVLREVFKNQNGFFSVSLTEGICENFMPFSSKYDSLILKTDFVSL